MAMVHVLAGGVGIAAARYASRDAAQSCVTAELLFRFPVKDPWAHHRERARQRAAQSAVTPSHLPPSATGEPHGHDTRPA